jgi:hypothetical protein
MLLIRGIRQQAHTQMMGQRTSGSEPELWELPEVTTVANAVCHSSLMPLTHRILKQARPAGLRLEADLVLESRPSKTVPNSRKTCVL